jgi:RHS repeat-associated protein
VTRVILAVAVVMAALLSCAGVAVGASVGALAWGSGLEGQLGDGTHGFESNENVLNYRASPVPICQQESPQQPCPSGPYLSGVQAMAGGSNFGLALLFGGQVLAWGGNPEGQLGSGGHSPSYVPQGVPSLTGGVAAISAGFEHALALLANGTVMSWGDNRGGDLGSGTCCTSNPTPAKVSGLSGAVAVAAGYNHSLALLSNGTVMAWGGNQDGQLGDGGTEGSDTPVAVSGLSGVVAIAAGGCCNGEAFSLALLSNGTVMAWGAGRSGQLGNGSTVNSDVPVAVSGLTGATAIAASSRDAYALLSGGSVRAWGENSNGQLGQGSNSGPSECEDEAISLACATRPVSVSGISTATAISASGPFVLALLANSQIVAWGNNNSGDLGVGTLEGPERCEYLSGGARLNEPCSKAPVEVAASRGVRGIAAGVSTGYAFGSGVVSTPILGEQLGQANPGEPSQVRCSTGKPVDCATGNETTAESDINIGGRGVPLTFVRTYNTQAAALESTPGAYGYGWNATFYDRLIINTTEGTDTVVQANGSTAVYQSTGQVGQQSAPIWVQATLFLNSDGTYTYTLPNQQSFHFDSAGRLLSESDRNGNTTTLNRNSEGRLESVSDAAGRKLTFAYNPAGQVEAVTDPMGRSVKYSYVSGSLVSVTKPGESTPRWQFKYDGSHRLTQITDGRGGITTNEYDGANRVISQTDPAKRTLAFEYGLHETTITNKATGSVTKEIFTEGGEPEAVIQGYGTAAATTITRTYDQAGDLLSLTDGDGHTVSYGYDAAGNRTAMRDADGDEAKWSYDTTHDVVTTTTPKGETTTIKRDSHGNPEVVERPGPGATTQRTRYKYDSVGELEAVTDPLERTTKYEYDSRGDRTAEIDPEGDKRTWSYNEDSQQTATVSARGNVEGAEASKYTTKIERDAQGRVIAVVDPLGHLTKYAYDANGNLESATDANAHTTKYVYDADNEQIKMEQPNGAIIETGYDGAGQTVSQTDGNKHATKYVRNVLEQIVEVIDPLGRKTVGEYDLAGNLVKLTDAAKRSTTNVFDVANRLKETSSSDGKTHTIKYEYDPDGDRTTMSDGTGTTTSVYDQLDRVIETRDGHGNVAKYEYDLANEQTKITYPSGKAITRSFDKADRLQKVTDWLEHTTTFAYNPDSYPTTAVYPAGTNNEDKATYNEADQLSEVKIAKGAETLASLAYTRDSDGQVKTVTSKGLPGEEKPAYEYDSSNRLIKAGSANYEYDAAGNLTKAAASTNTYDSGSELKTGTGVTYSYDELGERIRRTPTSGAATTYGYDQADNLIAIERPKEGKVPAISDAYGYNGDRLRTSQTISGTTTFLAWDTTEALPLLLNDGTNSYIYGPGGLPVEQINNSAGTVLYLHHDQAGSTRLLTGSTGKTEASFTYDSYGNQTGQAGTATTPLGYDGQYTSSDTGLIYLRARTYDPATAQFVSVDPAVSLTRAPYNYSGDNPVNHGDATGLSAEGVEGVPCYFPFCGPPPPAVEGLQHGLETVEHGIASVWNKVNENEGPNDEGEAVLREKAQQRECGERNPAQDKKLSPGQIKTLKEAGFDPHEFKEGGQGTDLYIDRDGNIYEKPIGGAGPGEPTGINIKELE